jgi:hypothetical protein
MCSMESLPAAAKSTEPCIRCTAHLHWIPHPQATCVPLAYGCSTHAQLCFILKYSIINSVPFIILLQPQHHHTVMQAYTRTFAVHGRRARYSASHPTHPCWVKRRDIQRFATAMHDELCYCLPSSGAIEDAPAAVTCSNIHSQDTWQPARQDTRRHAQHGVSQLTLVMECSSVQHMCACRLVCCSGTTNGATLAKQKAFVEQCSFSKDTANV